MKKSAKILVAVLCLMMLMSSLSVFAASAPYQTYTYSMGGDPMDSPHAYVPERTISNFDMGLETPLSAAKDLFVDDNEYVYISDTGNNRLLVLNENYNTQFEITTFINEHGVPDALLGPQGLFVDGKNIYALVITSNYLPSDIWKEDPECVAAVERRFKVLHLSSREDQQTLIDYLTGPVYERRLYGLRQRKALDGTTNTHKF